MTTPAPTFPIQQFIRIEANQITDAVNLLIVDINALFASLGVGSGGYASQHQLRAWASNNGSPLYIYTIDQAVDALISNDINIRWNHSATIVQGDLVTRLAQGLVTVSPEVTR